MFSMRNIRNQSSRLQRLLRSIGKTINESPNTLAFFLLPSPSNGIFEFPLNAIIFLFKANLIEMMPRSRSEIHFSIALMDDHSIQLMTFNPLYCFAFG